MSFTVEVQQRGLNLVIFAEKVQSESLPGLVAGAVDYGYVDMMSKAPVKSGRLLGSIQKQAEGLSGSVGPTVPYAVYVEYGTLPHEIRPMFASALRFDVDGKIVFTTLVHHPGTRPQPFVRETVEDLKEKIAELWQKVFEEATQG